jgi:hypothetical protein
VETTPGTAGSIRASAQSPKDGTVLAEVSVGVTYGETAPPTQASISIEIPQTGETISAQELVAVGQGTALPENNVVVRVLASDGSVIAEQPAIVDAEVGGSGEWRATLNYNAQPGGSGQVYAFSTSPVDGSVITDATVNVQFGEVAQPAITIVEPKSGQVVEPAQIVVNGIGTALPENNVVVRALDANGSVLAEQAVVADAELGRSGPWSAALVVDVAGGTPGRIEASSTSPADGSILAQSSVDVVYGAAAAQPAITITTPQPGAVVGPAGIAVNGIGTALPENNVVVRALDANGAVLAEQATVADAEVGGSGPWSVSLSVDVAGGTPGRIEASSTSPADGSVIAQASVDVVYGTVEGGQPAIAITAPQSGEVVGPAEIVVNGTGTALPENNVVVRALDENGGILAEQPTVADAEVGGSGPWSVTLSVDVAPGTPGRIEAFSTSPADASVVAQAVVDVVFGTEGAGQPEITIASPEPDATVDPAEMVVNGTGTALPENNVVVRILDENGGVLAEQATTIDAEVGGTGPWSLTLSLDPGESASGSVYAFSASPLDGSTVAEASVDVVFGRERD